MGLFKDCGCGCNGRKQQQKFMAALMGALIFFIIASPDTFRIVRRFFGNWVATQNGSPSQAGLLLHSLVFLLITWAVMNVRTEFMEAPEEPMTVAEEPLTEEPMVEEPMVEEPQMEMDPTGENDQADGNDMPLGEPLIIAEQSLVVEPLIEAEAQLTTEIEGFTMDDTMLTLSTPEGEIVDSCNLKSGKKLTITMQ